MNPFTALRDSVLTRRKKRAARLLAQVEAMEKAVDEKRVDFVSHDDLEAVLAQTRALNAGFVLQMEELVAQAQEILQRADKRNKRAEESERRLEANEGSAEQQATNGGQVPVMRGRPILG